MVSKILDKKEKLLEIYSDFENSVSEFNVSEFKKSAACKVGCADCCIYVGNVDITTMEGTIIQNRMESFEKKLKAKIRKKLDKNKVERERGILAKCAFLKEEDDTCRKLADYTISKMQQLDDTGYSGHMSFILYLLEKSGFRKTYIGGKFNPGKIMNFGKSHGIIINRFVKPKLSDFLRRNVPRS